MKNLFVLPTDKQSRLFVYDGKLGLAKGFQYGSDVIQNQNINITDDSGIKIGDWVIDDYAKINLVQKVRKCDFDSLHYKNGNWKKIILTTDQDLIKDGVQAIPDEFLEWFVKNPSCEEVGVVFSYKSVNQLPIGYHRIVIPKEEPKQICDNCKIEISKYGCACGGKPKQETLEEVGMYQQELFNYLHDLGVTALQSEMQEIERIVLGMQNINALHFEIDALKREIKVFKHQQEQDKNKFSEEDLISLLEFNYKKETNQLGTLRKDYSQKIVREWFKQFKNK